MIEVQLCLLDCPVWSHNDICLPNSPNVLYDFMQEKKRTIDHSSPRNVLVLGSLLNSHKTSLSQNKEQKMIPEKTYSSINPSHSANALCSGYILTSVDNAIIQAVSKIGGVCTPDEILVELESQDWGVKPRTIQRHIERLGQYKVITRIKKGLYTR